jgi:hypothetical protein
MRQVGCDEALGNVLQAGDTDVLGSSAQSSERFFERRLAKDGAKAFTDGRKDHRELIVWMSSERARMPPRLRRGPGAAGASSPPC